MDLAVWLDAIGLGQYAKRFADNDIDPETLVGLTNDDLKELGVASLGHRKKLLGAIASLAPEDQAAAEPSSPEPSATISTPATTEAERRQLTVMFCDLVGSTALSERLDPEDMHTVIRAYQNAVADEIAGFEGHVAKFMGDGVLAYFGWPQAHEDDAERAVRAGLAVTSAVAALRLPDGKSPACRIGIATGLVVVGDLVGEGAAQEEAVVGETPNIAARLQGLAEPGSVLVGPGTYRLLGDLFETADLGDQLLKGIAEPVHTWRILQESKAKGRFQALRGSKLTDFVGRDKELDVLVSRWQCAVRGEGQTVFLSGEAGIGKSRLTRALLERIATEPHIRLRYYCSPFHTNSALHPVIEQLQRAAGIGSDDDAEAKLDKLEAVLGQSTDRVADVAPLLADLCAIPAGDRYPPLKLTPQAQKVATFKALVSQLEGLAADQPVMVVLEDAHWIDPSTSDLFELMIERLKTLKVLLIIAFRPEFTPPWNLRPHISSLTLDRLGTPQGAALIDRLTRGKALPAEINEKILEKTEGVPLFVEELTQTVLESNILADAGDHYELVGQLPALDIPSTLHDSLLARLDRLGSAKQVAQIGAAIGREFSYGLIAEVAPLDQQQLQNALEQLTTTELVFQRGTPPEATYSFKHALVQDVAHSTMLRSRRRPLHARIVQALEERFPETAQTQPELLAYHCTDAGLSDKATHYWRIAGEQAARRAAVKEAIQYFQKALTTLDSTPESPERVSMELKVLTQLGPALMLAKGWAAPGVGEVYERARTLAHQLKGPTELVPPLVGSWLFYFSRGRLDVADEATDELFQVAETLGDPELRLQAHHAAWPVPMLRGAFAVADEHIEKGLALYDYEKHKHHAFVYMGHDPAVCGHGLGAQIVWALGFTDRARRHAEDALKLARRLGHAPTLSIALWFVGNFQVASGDIAGALSTAEDLFELSEKQALVQTRAAALAMRGWALAQSGHPQDGIEQIQAALDVWHRIGTRPYLQVFSCLLAECWMRTQQYVEALECATQALAYGKQSGERWWEARIHDLRGQLLLHSSSRNREGAAEAFETAIQIAHDQQAKALELRAATSLGRLWAEQGERQKAYDMLAPIYGWFTEGLDTPNLKDADKLLHELA